MRPDAALRDALIEMGREFVAEGDPRYPVEAGAFAHYLAEVARFEAGRELAQDRVRQSEYWLVHDGRLVGGCRLRHALIPVLMLDGGNVGYDIRPSERRKGYGHHVLALTIAEARRAALERLFLTCEETNVASTRIIEAAGGVEIEGSISPRNGNPMRRFWLDLALSAPPSCP
jgi:predicted acetyltransferase